MIDRVRLIGCVAACAGLALSMSAQGAPSGNGLDAPSTLYPALTNVHILAVDTEFFGPVDFGVWHANDAASGKNSGVDLDAARDFEESAGLYSIAAINANGGVSIMLPNDEAIAGLTDWDDLFATDQETVKNWLLTSDVNQLENWFASEVYDAGLATQLGHRNALFAFGFAEPGHSIPIVRTTTNIGSVPAPSALGIVGLGALSLLRRRR